jgi:hypothetical protein
MTDATSYVIDSHGPGDGYVFDRTSYVVCTLWDEGTHGGAPVLSETWSHHETIEDARECYADDIAAGAYSVTVARVILSTDYDTGGPS